MEKSKEGRRKARRQKVRLTLARLEDLKTREQRERFVAALLEGLPRVPPSKDQKRRH